MSFKRIDNIAASDSASRRLQQVKSAILEAVYQGAIAYANGRNGKAIVDQHFTEGNQGRYGWEPLSEAYFMSKSGMAVKGTRKDKFAQYKTATGHSSAKNLPMLVQTGALRSAMNSKAHTVTLNGLTGIATVLFRALPGYAIYLHEGTEKMPMRSPVNPNELDRQAAILVMKNYLSKRMGVLRKLK